MAAALRLHRRRFLRQTSWLAGAGLVAGVFSEQPARSSTRPGERLRIAAIGVGNRGASNLAGVRSEEVVVLCDVDRRFLESAQSRYPHAHVHHDLREALEHPDLDAALISTPDHTHYEAASRATRRGLHVYCEKPLTRTISESRQLVRQAEAAGVVTQMGNQHHNSEGFRRVVTAVQQGVLGDIEQVHCWTNRPLWPQGLNRPLDEPAVPDYLHWDLWLGPAAERPYHPLYHPIGWRGWRDFGCGALGDMGPHLLDPVVTSLRLNTPDTIEADAAGATSESFPVQSIVRYDFPPRDPMPACRVVWYDGGQIPPPAVTKTARPPATGILLLGTKQRLFVPSHGGMPHFFSADGSRPITRDDGPLPAVPDHHTEWIQACKTGKQPSCSFRYGARLTEICLLGNQAMLRRSPEREPPQD